MTPLKMGKTKNLVFHSLNSKYRSSRMDGAIQSLMPPFFGIEHNNSKDGLTGINVVRLNINLFQTYSKRITINIIHTSNTVIKSISIRGLELGFYRGQSMTRAPHNYVLNIGKTNRQKSGTVKLTEIIRHRSWLCLRGKISLPYKFCHYPPVLESVFLVSLPNI